jgi:hypothetical protein
VPSLHHTCTTTTTTTVAPPPLLGAKQGQNMYLTGQLLPSFSVDTHGMHITQNSDLAAKKAIDLEPILP